MIGKNGIERTFGRQFSDIYNIHRTRQGFPNGGMDTFSNMATVGIFIIDRIVQNQMGGGVSLQNDKWYIPNKIIDITVGIGS